MNPLRWIINVRYDNAKHERSFIRTLEKLEFTIGKNWKQSQRPSVGQYVNNCGITGQWARIYSNMVEYQKHFVEWKKPHIKAIRFYLYEVQEKIKTNLWWDKPERWIPMKDWDWP